MTTAQEDSPSQTEASATTTIPITESPINRCKHCKQKIEIGAHKCHHCASYQNKNIQLAYICPSNRLHRNDVYSYRPSLVKFQSAGRAKKQRITASDALEKAEQAKSRAQLASNAIERLSQDMNLLYNDAKSRVDRLENITKEANGAIADLKAVTDFTFILEEAKTDSRKALEDLFNIANSNDKRFSQFAEKSLVQIFTSTHVEGLIMPNVNWSKYNLEPDKASLEQLATAFYTEVPYTQVRMLYSIWNQSRFSKYDKISFLINVVRTTQSVKCLHQACKLLEQEAKTGKNFMAYEEFLQWWDKHKSCYRENDRSC